MNGFVTFIQTVGAQVVAYYLCKWLDSLIGKGVSTKKSPSVVLVPGGFVFCVASTFRLRHIA